MAAPKAAARHQSFDGLAGNFVRFYHPAHFLFLHGVISRYRLSKTGEFSTHRVKI
jgi:hypothetical protein